MLMKALLPLPDVFVKVPALVNVTGLPLIAVQLESHCTSKLAPCRLLKVAPSYSDMRPLVQKAAPWLVSVRWDKNLSPPLNIKTPSDSVWPLPAMVPPVH